MAKRNLQDTAERVRGCIPSEYDLRVEDMDILRETADRNLFSAFALAFRYGFVLGHRATKAERYKENPRKRPLFNL